MRIIRAFAYPRDVLPDDPLASEPIARNSISPSHFAKGVFDSQHSPEKGVVYLLRL
jgi:hypothetical protein